MTTHIVPIGFHAKQVYTPVTRYGGEKIIFITSEPKDSKSKKSVEDALMQAKKIAEESLSIKYEILKLKDNYDFSERMEILSKLFEKESEIIVNLTGGPKFDSFLLYITALKHWQKVKEIVYVREDIGELVILPKFIYSGSLTDFELEMLRTINETPISTNELADKLGKQLPQILRYLNQLEEKGLVISEKNSKERKIRIA